MFARQFDTTNGFPIARQFDTTNGLVSSWEALGEKYYQQL